MPWKSIEVTQAKKNGRSLCDDSDYTEKLSFSAVRQHSSKYAYKMQGCHKERGDKTMF